MPRRRYKCDVYARGVTATTGTITVTFESSRLTADQPIIVGGQTVRPTEGRTESEPYTIRFADVGSTVSSLLANSSGRMHLLSRLFRVRRATDSTAATAFKTLSVGRIQDVSLAPDIASYDFTITDERWVERNTDIFPKANTAMLIPPGLIAPWGDFSATAPATWRVVNIVGNLVCLRYDGVIPVPRADQIIRLIEGDPKSASIIDNTSITTGNFTHLRFKNTGSGTEYEIARFGAIPFTVGRPFYPYGMSITYGVRNEDSEGERDSPRTKLYVWLVWVTGQPALDTTVKGYLYMPTHPPSEELPFHVGGSSGDNPFSLASKIYSGTFSPTTSLTIRKSTAAFNKLTADPRYGKTWHRITRPWNMAEFLEQRIYQPYGAVPMIDSSGRVSPVSMLLPKSTSFTLANLPTLSSTNATIHPSWTHPSREIVTVVRGTLERYVYYHDPKDVVDMPADRLMPTRSTAPVNILQSLYPGELEAKADTSTIFGRKVLSLNYGMVSFPIDFLSTGDGSLFGNLQGSSETLFKSVTQAMLARFADGPIYSDFDATTGIDATTNGKLAPGSYIKVKLNTFPNPAANARGSTRVMQIITRRDHPAGVSGTLLDVGAALNPLTAPGLTLARSAQSSRHAVVATVSTALPAGSRYELQLGFGATTGSTAPVGYAPIANDTTANRTVTFGYCPSNTKVFARAKATKAGRQDSAFSAVQSVVTAKITGPSGIAISSITAGTAIAKWTNGSTRYPTEILLDATTSVTLGTAHRIDTAPPPTTRYDLRGLNSNDSHIIAVRHRDPFGGFSTKSQTVFTTTTGFTAAPSLRGLVIARGA